MYKGFQRKEQTVAVAIDLEDAYNRVQFKLLMDLVMQYVVSLTMTRWISGALLERTVVVCSLETGALLFIFRMETTRITALTGPLLCIHIGLANLNQNGPSKILTLADDGLI